MPPRGNHPMHSLLSTSSKSTNATLFIALHVDQQETRDLVSVARRTRQRSLRSLLGACAAAAIVLTLGCGQSSTSSTPSGGGGTAGGNSDNVGGSGGSSSGGSPGSGSNGGSSGGAGFGGSVAIGGGGSASRPEPGGGGSTNHKQAQEPAQETQDGVASSDCVSPGIGPAQVLGDRV